MRVITEDFEEARFHVLRAANGDITVWLPTPIDEGDDWQSFTFTPDQACNLSRRLGAIIDAENDRLSKRGA